MTDEKRGSGPFAMPGLDAGGRQMAEIFETLAKAQGQVMDSLLKGNIEVLGFVRDRLERDRALVAALSGARDPADAAARWTEFWQKAMADYGDESGKLSELAADLGREMLAALNPAAAEAMAAATPRPAPRKKG